MNANIVSVHALNEYYFASFDSKRIQDSDSRSKKFEKDFQLCNISFGYKYKKNVLNNISLKINKGDKILIKAPSGFGKTTLINIIITLIKPNKGQIKIDGRILGEQISLSQWRRQIGYVKQKSYLKSGRILDLVLGEEVPEREQKSKIKQAKYYCELVFIDEHINTLPNKYLEYINSDGSTLSGGQLQRLSIANALASNPSLLVMDESTSGLDVNIESKLLNNIVNLKDLTVLFISHSDSVSKNFKNQIDLTKLNKI